MITENAQVYSSLQITLYFDELFDDNDKQGVVQAWEIGSPDVNVLSK